MSNVPEDDIVKISVSKAGITFDPLFYTWNTRTGEVTAGPAGPPEANTAPELTALAVEYDGENDNLIGDFDPANKTYVINAEAGKSSVKMVEAEPEEGASVSIRYNNTPLEIGGTAAVPAEGAEAKVISITAEKDALSSEYRVVIAPPQNSATDDRSLMYLDVFYEGEQDSLISFSKSITDYTVNVSEQKASSKVRVECVIPSSSLSNADGITYGVDREHAVAVAKGELVAVPTTGNPAKKFFVEVQSQNQDTQSYIITINPYTPPAQANTWNGTVTLNSLAGKTAVQVIARGADTHQSHTAAVTDGNWTLDAPKTFVPVSFIVSVTDSATGTETLRSKQYKPAPVSAGTPIDLVVEGAPEVGKAVFSQNDLAGFPNDSANNYSLADDIKLPDTWDGPDNYHGNFYGNGYAIDVKLTKTTGNTGLFDSLANGAEINDLVLNVSSPTVGLAMSGSNYFGGLVGVVDIKSGEMWIRGVTVNGKLEYATVGNGYLVVGGFFGGMTDACSAVIFHIANCVSNIEFVADTHPGTGANEADFGGFIGCKRGNVIISNSYSTGNITISTNGDRHLLAGGLVARNSQSSLTINNCYSTGTISISKSGGSAGNYQYAGGLVGMSGNGLYYFNPSSAISNSAALNESVTVNNVGTYYAAKRIAGFINGSGTQTRSNNYALNTMVVGVTPGEVVTNGAADDINGLDKTDADFKLAATWAALSFDTAIWDFSTITTLGRPTLK